MDPLTSLLVDARDGDRLALSAFVRRTQADVWRFCAHLVDLEAADDLTQDTYVRASRSLERYRGDASARTWLLAIARNVCADEIRRRQRRRRLAVAGRDTTSGVAPDPTGEVDLLDLLGVLDDDRRAAFVLTQVLGLGYAEAAASLDVPIGTIRSRVARAREELVAALEGTGRGRAAR